MILFILFIITLTIFRILKIDQIQTYSKLVNQSQSVFKIKNPSNQIPSVWSGFLVQSHFFYQLLQQPPKIEYVIRN